MTPRRPTIPPTSEPFIAGSSSRAGGTGAGSLGFGSNLVEVTNESDEIVHDLVGFVANPERLTTSPRRGCS